MQGHETQLLSLMNTTAGFKHELAVKLSSASQQQQQATAKTLELQQQCAQLKKLMDKDTQRVGSLESTLEAWTTFLYKQHHAARQVSSTLPLACAVSQCACTPVAAETCLLGTVGFLILSGCTSVR